MKTRPEPQRRNPDGTWPPLPKIEPGVWEEFWKKHKEAFPDPTPEELAAQKEADRHPTPGPWRAWDRGIGWEIHHRWKNDEDGGWPLNGGFRETFREADARLMSAAPDLLKELRHLVRALEPLEDGHLEIPGLATLNGARKAIAKATMP